MKSIYTIIFLCFCNFLIGQKLDSYTFKRLSFAQQDILINEQISFYYFSNESNAFDITFLDRKPFIQAKEMEKDGVTIIEYYFPSVQLFFKNTQMNDYKVLFDYMIRNDVFDTHLNIDQLELIRFIINYNQK